MRSAGWCGTRSRECKDIILSERNTTRKSHYMMNISYDPFVTMNSQLAKIAIVKYNDYDMFTRVMYCRDA